MQNPILFALLFAVALIVGFAFTSSENSSTTASTIYRYGYNESTSLVDTITDTEIDTFTLATRLYSNWDYNWTVRTSSLSGTRALVVYLDESNDNSGNNDWLTVDSLVISASVGTARMALKSSYTALDARVAGVRQRIRTKGSGTQSTKYWIQATFKK